MADKVFESLKCKTCGKDIRFLKVRTKDGAIKKVPVPPEAVFGYLSSGSQDENGKWIYDVKKVYLSHFDICKKEQTEETPANTSETDKPPF